MSIDARDRAYLDRCVALAAEAVDAGDEAFGSLLIAADRRVLFEDRNRVRGGDPTHHPEYAIARWAAEHLSPDERRAATVYTSGEHCAMCAAAHGLVGLGRIVYATSTAQLTQWMRKLGRPPMGIAPLPITTVIPDTVVDGPVPELADAVRALHARAAD